MDEQLIRTQMLLGRTAMERLRASHVAVLGLGGVGDNAGHRSEYQQKSKRTGRSDKTEKYAPYM